MPRNQSSVTIQTLPIVSFSQEIFVNARLQATEMGRNGPLRDRPPTDDHSEIRMGHEMTSRDLKVRRWWQTVVNKYVESFEMRALASESAANKSVRRSEFEAQLSYVINCGNGWTRPSALALLPFPCPSPFALSPRGWMVADGARVLPRWPRVSHVFKWPSWVAVALEPKCSLFCWKWVHFSGDEQRIKPTSKANAAHEYAWF